MIPCRSLRMFAVSRKLALKLNVECQDGVGLIRAKSENLMGKDCVHVRSFLEIGRPFPGKQPQGEPRPGLFH